MRGAPIPRFARPLALAILAVSFGCTQIHYHGEPPYAAYPAGAVPYGSVCEVPSAGTVVTQGPAGTTVVAAPPRGTRVVVSEPTLGPVRSGSRYSWRGDDPANLATTRSEGGLEDDARIR